MSIVDYDFITGVYPSVGKSDYKSEEVNSYHSPYAQAQIEGLLASHYSVPFSTDNLTAKDLVATLVYSRLAPMDENERRDIRTELYERIERLKNGDEIMITDSGSMPPDVAGSLWSSTQDYHPTFTIDDPLNWVVSSEALSDLRGDRGQTFP